MMAQIMMFMETHPYIMDTDVREWRCVSLALTSLIPWKTNQIPRRCYGVSSVRDTPFSCTIFRTSMVVRIKSEVS